MYIIIRNEVDYHPYKYDSIPGRSSLDFEYDGRRNVEVKIMNRSHYDRLIYDMNEKSLNTLMSNEDTDNSNYNYETRSDERNNPFFRTDSQFQSINIRCEHIK